MHSYLTSSEKSIIYKKSWEKQYNKSLFNINKKIIDKLVDKKKTKNILYRYNDNIFSEVFGCCSASELYEFAMNDMFAFMTTYGLSYDSEKIQKQAEQDAKKWFEDAYEKNNSPKIKKIRHKPANLIEFLT